MAGALNGTRANQTNPRAMSAKGRRGGDGWQRKAAEETQPQPPQTVSGPLLAWEGKSRPGQPDSQAQAASRRTGPHLRPLGLLLVAAPVGFLSPVREGSTSAKRCGVPSDARRPPPPEAVRFSCHCGAVQAPVSGLDTSISPQLSGSDSVASPGADHGAGRGQNKKRNRWKDASRRTMQAH